MAHLHGEDAHSDSDQVAFALSFRDDLLRSVDGHSSDRRKELPLVRVRMEIGVNKYTGVLLARRSL